MLDIKKLLTKILKRIPAFEYSGNVSQIHWSSWTAPSDGIVVIDIGWLTGGGFGYYYVKDTTADFRVGKVTAWSANGTSNTTSFPVLKGHTYKVSEWSQVNGSEIFFRFYALTWGGYCITSFMSTVSRLVERWWGHVRRKGFVYETAEQAATCSRRSEKLHVRVRKIVCGYYLLAPSWCKSFDGRFERQTECRLDIRRHICNRNDILPYIVQQYIQYVVVRKRDAANTLHALISGRGCFSC